MARIKLQFEIKKKYKTQRNFCKDTNFDETRLSQIIGGQSLSQDMVDFFAEKLGKSPEFLFGKEYKREG